MISAIFSTLVVTFCSTALIFNIDIQRREQTIRKLNEKIIQLYDERKELLNHINDLEEEMEELLSRASDDSSSESSTEELEAAKRKVSSLEEKISQRDEIAIFGCIGIFICMLVGAILSFAFIIKSSPLWLGAVEVEVVELAD